MARSLTPTVVLVCLALASCNRPVASKTAHETSTSRPATQGDTRLELHDLGDLAQAVRPPAQIVEAFLVAVREGDHRTTAFLLTDKARVETAKHDLVVEPPGTPSAKFVIGDVEFVGEEQNGAHVNTVWDRVRSVRRDSHLRCRLGPPTPAGGLARCGNCHRDRRWRGTYLPQL